MIIEQLRYPKMLYMKHIILGFKIQNMPEILLQALEMDHEITFEDNFPEASRFLPPLLHKAGSNGMKTCTYELHMHLNHF